MATKTKENKELMQIDLTKLNVQQLHQLKSEFESVINDKTKNLQPTHIHCKFS